MSASRESRAADAAPTPTAKRGRLGERVWADIVRAADLCSAKGVTIKLHGAEISGLPVVKAQGRKLQRPKRQQQQQPQRKQRQQQNQQQPPPAQEQGLADEPSPAAQPSKRKLKQQQRLEEFLEKKRQAARAHCIATCWEGDQDRGMSAAESAARARAISESSERRRNKSHQRQRVRAKLRALLWRAWAQYRPIFGGAALGYTSLREQHVYKRAAALYHAAFKLDPGKSGRMLTAWLRKGQAVPMLEDRGLKRDTRSPNVSQTSSPQGDKGKKSRTGSLKPRCL
jgi:hypothetical protein